MAVIGRSFFGLEAVPETAAPVLTVILFGTLAASLGPWLRDRTPSAWLGAAIALLCVVWANPGFIPRVVFTNYGDASTAALLGIALTVFLFHWQRKSLPGLLQLGFILAAIVNTKQTGLVIVAIFVCATIAGLVLLSGWPRRSFTGTGSGTHASAQGEPGPPVALSRGGYLLAFCAVLLPAILMWLLWRHHAEAATGGFNIRPLAQWSWALAPQTLASMGQVLFSKIAFTSASLLAIFLALRAWRSGSSASLGQAATIFSLALLAWVAALFVFYMGGSFNEFEVAAAASFWRYISQFAGALGVVLALALVSSAWLRSGAACLVARAPQGLRRGLVTFPAVLVFILPALAFGELWPRSREPAPPLRRAAEQLRPMLPQGGTVLVVDPQGNGMSHVALAFAWRDWLRVIWAPEFYRRESLTAEQLLDRAAATQADVVFLVSTDREVERAFGTGAIQGHGWRVLRRTETGWLPLAEGRWR